MSHACTVSWLAKKNCVSQLRRVTVGQGKLCLTDVLRHGHPRKIVYHGCAAQQPTMRNDVTQLPCVTTGQGKVSLMYALRHVHVALNND